MRTSDALIVNLLDSKLSAPNADYPELHPVQAALAEFTDLSARALASKGIRVNAIAPGLMLRSSGQTEENFRAMHANNPLRRGVEPERRHWRDPLFHRRSLRDRAGDRDRFRAAFHGAWTATCNSWRPSDRTETDGPRSRKTSGCDRRESFSNSLEVQTDIGFHDFEVGAPQRLMVTVEIWLDPTPSSRTTTIPAQAWNYDFLRTEVRGARGRAPLQSSGDAGARDFRLGSRRFEGSSALRVRTSKPDVYPEARGCRG